jgi:predicted ferric reductase
MLVMGSMCTTAVSGPSTPACIENDSAFKDMKFVYLGPPFSIHHSLMIVVVMSIAFHSWSAGPDLYMRSKGLAHLPLIGCVVWLGDYLRILIYTYA